jgi:flagellar hook-associated protein 2
MVSSTSSSASSAPISMAGLVSGLDTKSMIQQLIDAQKGPANIMQGKVSLKKQEVSAIGDVNTRLTNLLTQIQSFSSSTYLLGRSTMVSPGGATQTVSATADSTAAVGSFKVTVDTLATATSLTSGAPIGAGVVAAGTPLSTASVLGTAVTSGTITVDGVAVSIDATKDLNYNIGQIQAANPNLTVTVVPDAPGHPANRLQITDGTGAAVTLGAGADTSNFLSAAKLLASTGGSTRMSTGDVGGAQTGGPLARANLATAINGTGTFKVNGVEIGYDASSDSLSTVLSKINNSTAGVVASYDPTSDSITLVSKTTGSTAISLQDETGNFLAASGLLNTTQNLGKNAKYEIDPGTGTATTYYSTSNTVTNALPGVTLNLLHEGVSADTVSVNQDVNGAVQHVKDLVSQFNSTLDFIRQSVAVDASNQGNEGPLSGNYQVQAIGDELRQMMTSTIDGNTTTGITMPSDVGLSFGAVGATVGSTNDLVLDETKLRAALTSNPSGVANLFSAFGTAGTLNPGGKGNVSAVSGGPSALRVGGTYALTTTVNGDGTANITSTFTPSDGSASFSQTVNNVAAGTTNTTLIPGMTLTFGNSFAAGSDTITVTTPTRGLEAKFEQYLTPLTRTGGTLSSWQDTDNTNIKDMNDQITQMNTRLQQQTTYLQNKFAQMEQALQKLQEQRTQLSSIPMTISGG